MSALGQKQTYAVQNGMSALPPKATSTSVMSTRPKDYYAAQQMLRDRTQEVRRLRLAREASPHVETRASPELGTSYPMAA
jgi:hypothetical protein